MQRLQPSSLNGYGSFRSEGMSDQFPAGLRVLVVDDDLTCLKILEQMLKKCKYTVTTCSRAAIALSLLREKKGGFDIVISDVHMPDMDGYKLLELVGLEMDLPVIMMSADGSTASVMRGVKHGACDYLIKPVRLEELKNIWQHIIRKKHIENKEHEQSGSLEDNDRHKLVCDDTDYASSVNEETDDNWKVHKKRKELKDEEDEGELDNEDPSVSKKPRVVWSVELHKQFVNAVNQLGIEKAVPKRILELMNVPDLTRENVASHLQKFRLYLKRLSANQGSMCAFGGSIEPNGKMSPIANVSMQAFAASGQIPLHTFAALHAEILGHHPGSLVMPGVDQSTLLQETLHGSKGNLIESVSMFAPPLMKSQTPVPKQFAQANIDDPSGCLAWQQPLSTATFNSIDGLNSNGNNMLAQMRQHQQPQQQTVQLDSGHVLNIQPSCLVTPALSNCFPGRMNPVSSSGTHGMGNPNFSGSSFLDYSLLSSPNRVPFGMGQVSDGDIKNVGLLRYSVPGSIPPAASSCSILTESNTSIQNWQVHNSVPLMNFNQSGQLPVFAPTPCEISYGVKGGGELLDQGASRSLGFVSRGPISLNRLGVDSGSVLSFTGDISQATLCLSDDDNVVKQEINLDFMDNVKVGMPILQHFSPSDLMSVLSK